MDEDTAPDRRARRIAAGGYAAALTLSTLCTGGAGVVRDFGWAGLGQAFLEGLDGQRNFVLLSVAAVNLGLWRPRTPLVLLGFVAAFALPIPSMVLTGMWRT